MEHIVVVKRWPLLTHWTEQVLHLLQLLQEHQAHHAGAQQAVPPDQSIITPQPGNVVTHVLSVTRRMLHNVRETLWRCSASTATRGQSPMRSC